MQDREARLVKANQDLESTNNDLKLAREEAAAIAAELQREQEALSVSRARTSELHTLGVDMERELTAMLKGIDELGLILQQTLFYPIIHYIMQDIDFSQHYCVMQRSSCSGKFGCAA